MKILKWRLLDLFLSIPATGAVTLVPTIPATKPAPKWSIGPSSRPVFVLAKCLVCLGLFELMENLHQANYQFRSLPMKRKLTRPTTHFLTAMECQDTHRPAPYQLSYKYFWPWNCHITLPHLDPFSWGAHHVDTRATENTEHTILEDQPEAWHLQGGIHAFKNSSSGIRKHTNFEKGTSRDHDVQAGQKPLSMSHKLFFWKKTWFINRDKPSEMLVPWRWIGDATSVPRT